MAEWNNVEMIMLNDAADQLSTFNIKNVHPTPVFRGDLNLGDVVQHPHQSLVVPVFMYARTYEAKLPTAKKWSALSETQTDEKFLTHDVGKEVAYKIKGSSNPVSNEDASADSYANGSAEASTSASASAPTQASTSAPTSASAAGQITYEDLERAYPFGKSLVVITEEDEKFMKLSTKAGLFILGFVSADKVSQVWELCLSCLLADRISTSTL
jgi:ATP-dependent DNA helicase 2 subunit 2